MAVKQQVKKPPAKRVAKKQPAKPAARKQPAKPVSKKQAAKPVAKKQPAKPVAKKQPAKPVARKKSSGPVSTKQPAKPLARKQQAKPDVTEKRVVKEKRVAKEQAADKEKLSTMTTERVKLKKGYKPRKNEEYMCPEQLEYFRQKLLQWRHDLIEESRETITHLQHEVRDVGDEAERATRETENSLELRTRDRYRKLIRKIDKALIRIEEGDYGYCEETGEEIGIERLEARPIATLCLDAQERWELRQRQLGETR
jgi:DnaK suppressor protein